MDQLSGVSNANDTVYSSGGYETARCERSTGICKWKILSFTNQKRFMEKGRKGLQEAPTRPSAGNV